MSRLRCPGSAPCECVVCGCCRRRAARLCSSRACRPAAELRRAAAAAPSPCATVHSRQPARRAALPARSRRACRRSVGALGAGSRGPSRPGAAGQALARPLPLPPPPPAAWKLRPGTRRRPCRPCVPGTFSRAGAESRTAESKASRVESCVDPP